jgi:hypothetical protein
LLGAGAYKISGGANGGVLVLAGMLLAFLLVAALFFISTPLLEGLAGFISQILITLSVSDDPDVSADYAITRLVSLVGSFAMLVILTGTVYMVVPLLFFVTIVFSMIAAMAAIIRHIISVVLFNRDEEIGRYV